MKNIFLLAASSALAVVGLPSVASAQHTGPHFVSANTTISGIGFGRIGLTECEAVVTGVTGAASGEAAPHTNHTHSATVTITNTTPACADKAFTATVNADGSGVVAGNSVINALCGVTGPVSLPAGWIVYTNASPDLDAVVPTFMFGGCPLSLEALVGPVQWHG